MIAYIDSSVVLRLLLGQPNRLKEWSSIDPAIASALVEVECLRTLDRLRLRTQLSHEELAVRREAVFRLVEEMVIVEPTSVVLKRAAQPLPTPLGTLDAIHLSTAIIWREQRAEQLVMATHDRTLAVAARASGLPVLGV